MPFNSDASFVGSEMGMSMMSRTDKESKSYNDARIVAQATSQATNAARSILESGGSEATALKTAKAAAQSVLLQTEGANASDDASILSSMTLTKGPGILRRRKAKRQADVVASMALMAASSSIAEENFPVRTVDQRLDSMQKRLDDDRCHSKDSWRNADRPSRINMVRKLSPVNSAESDESEEMGRPVNIRITTQSRSSSLDPHSKYESLEEEDSDDCTDLTPETGLRSLSLKSPDGKMNVVSPRSSSRCSKSKDLTMTLSQDDPIYYMKSSPSNNGSQSEDDDDDETDPFAFSATTSAADETEGNSTIMDSPSESIADLDQKGSFMEKHVDPFFFWSCGDIGIERTAKEPVKKSLSDVSSVKSDELIKGLDGKRETREEENTGGCLPQDPDTRDEVNLGLEEGVESSELFEGLSGESDKLQAPSKSKSGRRKLLRAPSVFKKGRSTRLRKLTKAEE